MKTITLYHNPLCSKSRETLAIIRDAGFEPNIIEYLTNPFSRHELQELAKQLQCPISGLMRVNDALYAELKLRDENCSDEKHLDALLSRPQLFNRPIAVSALGARICRPPELVLEILPTDLQKP
jgi:arsenate reductase